MFKLLGKYNQIIHVFEEEYFDMSKSAFKCTFGQVCLNGRI